MRIEGMRLPESGPVFRSRDANTTAWPIAPRAVKRALDYMHANLEGPITSADIVAASGVAERTLFEQFRAFKGTSPMRYLREARLTEARRDLRRGEPGAKITEIATRWGFFHFGRFAHEYRRRFGEPPRATLSAARRTRPEDDRDHRQG